MYSKICDYFLPKLYTMREYLLRRVHRVNAHRGICGDFLHEPSHSSWTVKFTFLLLVSDAVGADVAPFF